MIRRFCLYGFLKNQQYFDPFILLVFLEKGLSYSMIGLLFGFRAVCIAVMEVPTGGIADVIGRRRAMIYSHVAYIGAFLVFGLLSHVWFLFLAMFLFSIGEAFRTGTHKAIIFSWLTHTGRASEKTRVYGFTRSWSKVGSAVSVVISAALVFMLKRYSVVFLFCVVPYAVNILNFLSYPAYLDGGRGGRADVRRIIRVLASALRNSLRNSSLRRLLVESMGFEGGFRVSKDYLQPVIKAAALSVPLFAVLADRQRTAILIGAVYFVLYVLAGYASRNADAFVRWVGSEGRGARALWGLNLALFVVMASGVVFKLSVVSIGAFVGLFIVQNFWRPILVSRVAEHARASQTATVLSLESQGRSLFVAVVAPLLGLAVDRMPKEVKFLPVALLGLGIATLMLVWPVGGVPRIPSKE